MRPVVQCSVAAGVKQPTRERAGRPWFPYLALLQVGFGRRCVAALGRALLPPDFTLAATDRQPPAVCFCATFRLLGAVRFGAWGLPSTLSGGARTFLPETVRSRGGHPAVPAFS